jgi:hypothetical protein
MSLDSMIHLTFRSGAKEAPMAFDRSIDNAGEVIRSESPISDRKWIGTGILGGLIGMLTLSGSLLLGGGIGSLFEGMRIHIPSMALNVIAAITALIVMLGGGAAWGLGIGKLVGSRELGKMARAGAVSYMPSVLILGTFLSILAGIFVEGSRQPPLPIYIFYTVLFVPTSFVVGAVGGFALGRAHRGSNHGNRLWLWSGLAAAIAFLLVNTIMEALGYQVGAPGALERATMITVTFVGHVAAAFAAGATIVMGLIR